jgi:hypothetical protein
LAKVKPAALTVARLLGTQGFHRINRSGAPGRENPAKAAIRQMTRMAGAKRTEGNLQIK